MEESIHVNFDENDNGILSEGFADLKLSHDDEDESNMQEKIHALHAASLETNS